MSTSVDVALPSGQTVRFVIPTSYSSVTGAPLVIVCHGTGQDHTCIAVGAVPALEAGGYIQSASDQHGTNMGSPDAVQDNVDLYNYAVANYTITRVVIWSVSMGGLSGLNTILDGRIPVRGWLGTYPMVNLLWAWQNGWAGNIKTAFGFSNNADYAARTAGYDPALALAAQYAGKWFRWYASYGDATVPQVSNTDVVRLLTALGVENALVECTGDHGDASHYNLTDYVQFFDRCTKTRLAAVGRMNASNRANAVGRTNAINRTAV